MSTTDVDDREDQAAEEGGQEAEKPRLQLEVKVDSPSACERHVTVTIAKEDVDRYLKEAYDELMPQAQLPGFRPGRAPRKLVETRFKESVGDQVKGKLLMDSLTQMTDDHQFTAISEPDLDIDSVQFPEDGPMVFEFDIEVRPEFDVPQWRGLRIDRPVHETGDAEVEERLQKMLARYGHLEVKEGPIEAGDHVTITFRAASEGRQLSQLTEETVELKPVLSFADARLEGFDQLLLGKQPGETVTTKVTISPEAENEAFRGKEVDLSLELVALERRKLPEMTAAFLERIGGFESADELRNLVRREMERQLNYFQQRRVRQQITAQLTITATWDLPQELLRRQSRRELERAVLELQSSGFSQEQIQTHMNELRQNAMASTARALKEHFIFEKIAEEEGIDTEPEDFDREVELLAEQSDESPRRVRARLEKRGMMDALRNQIVERKVIERIQEQAEFRDIPHEPQKDEVVAVAYTLAPGGEAIPQAEHDEGINPATAGKTNT
jgi:trigger factor